MYVGTGENWTYMDMLEPAGLTTQPQPRCPPVGALPSGSGGAVGVGSAEAGRGDRASGLDSIWPLAARLPLELIISWATAQGEQQGIAANSCPETSGQCGAGLASKAHLVWGSGRVAAGYLATSRVCHRLGPHPLPSALPTLLPAKGAPLVLMSSLRSSGNCFPVDAEGPTPAPQRGRGL